MWKNIWLTTDQTKVIKALILTADNQARQPVASQVFEDVAAAQVGHYLYHLLKWPTVFEGITDLFNCSLLSKNMNKEK